MFPLKQTLAAAVALALGAPSCDALAASLDPKLSAKLLDATQPLEVIVSFEEQGAPSAASRHAFN